MNPVRHRRAVWAVLLACGAAAAQGPAPADSVFERAARAYRDGRFAEALGLLEALDRDRPNHVLTTASLLLEAKSLYRMGESQRADEAYRELIRNYPRSAYVDDARYGLAQTAFRRNAPREAVLHLLALLSAGGSKPLLDRAESLASGMMDVYWEVPGLKDLVRDAPDEKGKAFIVLKIARREIEDRRFQSARDVLDAFLGDHPANAYAPVMERLRERAGALGKGVVTVGAVLPLTGPLAEQGNALLAGIRHAVARNNETRNLKVDLEARDSEGNLIKAVKAAQELAHREDVAVLIGDVESSVTGAVAAVAQENGLPCIAPAAMEDGLTEIGPNVFQLNGGLGDRARALAEYAHGPLGLKRFAVLVPSDAYGRLMRKAFAEAVTRLGGEILADKWYHENTLDFNPIMGAIREAGLKRQIQDSLEAARGRAVTDLEKQFVDREAQKRLDARELPVTSIDGFLLVLYKQNVETLLSQLNYHNFQTQLLGGATWDDLGLLIAHKDVLEGVVFFSDFYADPYSPRTAAFRSSFRKAAGKAPEKMEFLGFDAASVAVDAMGDRAMPRPELRDALAAVRAYDGVRGTVSFEDRRVNPAFRLLQFREGKTSVVR